MPFKTKFRSIFSMLLAIVILSGVLVSGSVTTVRADGPLPPPPTEDGVVIDPDIVGGAPADPGEWPWQVALVDGSNLVTDFYQSQFCGGSLIASQWVLTAAHCVKGSLPSQVDVVAGIYALQPPTPGFQRRDLSAIYVHPSYNALTHDYDIALLKLMTPVSIGGSGASKTGLVSLMGISAGDLSGLNAWVTGWGATESTPNYPTELREVQVPILPNGTCNDANHYAGGITSNMLCAGFEQGGKDSCQGDSGGPLVVDVGHGWQLAGVVSWGVGCADAQRPGVYTRVANFANWISGYVPITVPGEGSLTIQSNGVLDGWILESSETSNAGGLFSAAGGTLNIGDYMLNKQYRTVLSFDTSMLPANAQITSVTLKLRSAGFVGTNPFTTHGALLVDILSGAFNGSPALEAADFNAPASVDGAMTIPSTLTGGWVSASLDAGNFGWINLGGLTQFRLRFTLDDNNDNGADYLRLYSGNSVSANRPQLIIQYTLP